MPKLPDVPPTLLKKSMSGDVYEHPSWGLAHVSRVSGGSGVLFGSNVDNMHRISLSIGRAKKIVNDLGDEHTHGQLRGELIEVSFSETQWARLLSSMGDASGVQCTINYIDRVEVPGCPAEDVAEQFHTAVKNAASEASVEMTEAVASIRTRLGDPRPLGKAERQELMRDLDLATMILKDRIPYIQKIAGEKIEEQVSSAKANFDAFVAYKAHLLLGMERVEASKRLESETAATAEREDLIDTFLKF